MRHQVSDAIVFFGATGDLAYKQIFPALQGLIRDEGLDIPIIGVAKAGWSLDQLKARAKDSLSYHGGLDTKAFARLTSLLRFVDGDYNDPATYVRLRQELGDASRPLHYLAIPPSLFATVAEGLAKSAARTEARLVVEKPFGHNRESARQLDRILNRFFPEEDIFRIDHYLGKEPVQNILYTRFAKRCSNRSGTAFTSTIFRSLWLKVLACRIVANSMMRPAPFVMCFKTTCCRCSPA